MVGRGMPFVFSPRKIRTSVPDIVLAPTLTRTSSGPMSGVSTSITSIWPGRRNTAASILLLLVLSLVIPYVLQRVGQHHASSPASGDKWLYTYPRRTDILRAVADLAQYDGSYAPYGVLLPVDSGIFLLPPPLVLPNPAPQHLPLL